MNNNQSIVSHAFPTRMMTSVSFNQIFLLRCVKWYSSFRVKILKVDIALYCLKHIESVLSAFTRKPIPLAVYSTVLSRRICEEDKSSVWAASVEVSAIYIFLIVFNVKPFPFIRSVYIRRTQRQIISRHGTNVSPCKTPKKTIKNIGATTGWANDYFRIFVMHY